MGSCSNGVTCGVDADELGAAGDGITVTLASSTSAAGLFSSPSFSGTSGSLSGGAAASTIPGTIYSYTIPAPGASTAGYDSHGNLLSYSDCVPDTSTPSGNCVPSVWGMSYTTLNQLSSSSVTAGPWNGLGLSWNYDAFGNRETQTPTGTPNTPVPAAQALSFPGSNNQMSGYNYDAAGNLTGDHINQYVYDAEGRVCAIEYVAGLSTAYMEYMYDGEGRRVAKGSIQPTLSQLPLTSAACDDPVGYSFSQTESYVLDQSGKQISELDGSGNFLRSHIYANGQLLASFTSAGTEFALGDWVGTKRVVARQDGTVAGSCISLPFGDALICGGSASLSGHHFTGQVHDQESGNDDFGARYYSNNMGRFVSPDWSDDPEAVPYADISNPQSLNLYAYALNNPITNTDFNGHACDDSNATFSSETTKGSDTENFSDTVVVSGNCNPPEIALIRSPISEQVSRTPTTQPTQGAPSDAPAVPMPSTGVCTGAGAVAGASAGALIGEGAGTLVGGGVGTLVAPGVGTVGGGAAGATGGATVGASIGGVLGGIIGNVLCAKGTGPSFGGNSRQNQQANDAKRDAEKEVGKKMTNAQEDRFHDEVSHQGLGYWEMREIAVQILEGII
jgi:RHS repeat-associated protein